MSGAVRAVLETPAGVLVALGALAGLGFFAAVRWQRWRGSRLASARSRRGHQGQAKAARLLEQAGFDIEDSHPRVAWVTRQDGAAHEVELRGDYLVRKGGLRYVAEVKTGDASQLESSSATRRQLLEYQLAFGVDGVLLVCPERRAVHHVEFEGVTRGRARRGGLGLAALATAAALGWVAARYLVPAAAPPVAGPPAPCAPAVTAP